jgi:hypothetical protein
MGLIIIMRRNWQRCFVLPVERIEPTDEWAGLARWMCSNAVLVDDFGFPVEFFCYADRELGLSCCCLTPSCCCLGLSG